MNLGGVKINVGTCLSHEFTMPYEPLQSRRIAAALAGQPIGHDVQVFDELPSTSDYVRELGQAGYPHGTVVFTECQPHGRGRRENRWQSEPGQDLLFSILLRPQVSMEYWPRLTSVTALALCKALEVTSHLQPLIKWPNDIYLDSRKTAGILAETFTCTQGAFMVLGIGLNVNGSYFPDEIASIATSLRLSSGKEQPRERLAIAFLQEFNRLVPQWQQDYGQIVQGIRERSLLLGRAIRARMDDGEVSGQAVGLNEEGHLLLKLADGSDMVLSSAEQVRWD